MGTSLDTIIIESFTAVTQARPMSVTDRLQPSEELRKKNKYSSHEELDEPDLCGTEKEGKNIGIQVQKSRQEPNPEGSQTITRIFFHSKVLFFNVAK